MEGCLFGGNLFLVLLQFGEKSNKSSMMRLFQCRCLFPALVILFLSGCTTKRAYEPPDWGMVETIIVDIEEPVFSDYLVSVIRFGAVEGGEADCSEAIRNAIDDVFASGGGTVLIPAGIFYTGPIRLKSNVRIHLEKGAELRFSTDPGDYLPVVKTRWEGIDCYNYHPLIYALDAENVALTGEGILNGMADREHWWPWKGKTEYGFIEGSPSQLDPECRPRLKLCNERRVPLEERIFGDGYYLRPQFIHFNNCKNILLEDITIIQSPFWLIHPLLSENIILRRVTMQSSGPNNDGFDPESSRNILVEECLFKTGDDCIAIKSGRNEDGRKWNRPSENIVIRNCIMHNGHGGVVLGSETSGGCRNVFTENCVMDSPDLDRAIRIKTNSLRGGITENIYFRKILVGEVDEAVLRINCHYDSKKEGEGDFPPVVRNIHLNQVESKASKYALFLEGVEDLESIRDIYVVDCTFEGVEEHSIVSYVTNLKIDHSFENGILLTIRDRGAKHSDERD